MANIYIVTDQREGEPDILSPVKNESLVLKVDGKIVFECTAPDDGWCHQTLQVKANDFASNLSSAGVIDAYLETVWVGSSEA